MMILSVSWRNVWRNKLRSSVILIAIALGIFSGIFTWTFYKGMVDQRIESTIKTEVSHMQMHPEGYMENAEVQNYISDSIYNLSILDTLNGIKSYSKRIISSGMMVSAKTGSGVQIIGIDPEKEKEVTNIYEKLVDGEYLQGIKRNPILIGQELAEKLNVKLRSRVVVNMQQLDGEITRAQFKVAGIYRTSNSMYDEMNCFVRSADLLNILHANDNLSHEVAIYLDNHEDIESVKAKLEDIYPTLDIRHWRELMPEVSLLEETMNVQMIFVLGIILLALCFGIVNTMLMAVLERVKELGMLMAVGMNKLRVFVMIMLETVFLSLSGGVVGIVMGILFTLIYSDKGISLAKWSEAYARLGYDTLIFPVLEGYMVYTVAFLVIVTGIIASVFPAIKALRLKPAEAIRSDM